MSGWMLTGASIIGPGHEIDCTPNQDAFLARRIKGGFLMVVCDGMGSRSHSHIGSKLACRAVLEIVKKSPFSIDARVLIELVYKQWLALLGSVAPNDAITTCLISWGNPRGQVRYFQLGDGRVLAPDMTQERDSGGVFGNETTGLGQSKKFSDWSVNEGAIARGQAIVMMTDGISEDLQPGCEPSLINALCGDMTGKNSRRGKKYLSRELRDWPTPNHIDDKTIAIVIRR